MWRLVGSRSMFIKRENNQLGWRSKSGWNTITDLFIIFKLKGWINKKGRVVVQKNCCVSSVLGNNYPARVQNAQGLSNHGLVQLLVFPKNGLFGLFGPFDAKPSKKTDAEEIPKWFSVSEKLGAYLLQCICHFWDAFAFALVFVISYGALSLFSLLFTVYL